MSRKIFIDIGNSFVKIKSKNLIEKIELKDFSVSLIPKDSNIWVSNVTKENFFHSDMEVFYVSSHKKYKKLINGYKAPESLGVDRWMSLIAAYEFSDKRNYIVVDIGTAVTIDIVKNNVFIGGLIMPSLERIRSTFSFSANIAHICPNFYEDNTENCWNSGTYYLLLDSLNSRVKNMKKEVGEDINIFITGGGASYFIKSLDFDFQYFENLVLDGLELYAHNMG